MGAVFSEQDIVNLCTRDDNQSRLWRQAYDPLNKPKEFFWGTDGAVDHEELTDLVADAQANASEQRPF